VLAKLFLFALLQNDSFIYISMHERMKRGKRDERGNASCRGMDDERFTRKVRYLTGNTINCKLFPPCLRILFVFDYLIEKFINKLVSGIRIKHNLQFHTSDTPPHSLTSCIPKDVVN
jgi:hypothetical protein